ncbi:MAG TPA: DoxX family protein [Nocardioidaceae bacterium]|nr:DoxX family protein [Nocardioidaceae bacterium]
MTSHRTEYDMTQQTQTQTAAHTDSRTSVDASASRRARTIGGWTVRIVLAVQFASAGLMKLAGTQVMVDLFADIGIGQWFRLVVGALELAGAIGLLVPRLAWLAALGLAGVMAGAVVTNVAVLGENPTLPAVLLVVAALIARARWPRCQEQP